MGQLSVAMSPDPTPRKQKIIAAVAAVVIGHAGVLWVLANMEPMQLRPVEPPKPVQVKFVKIVEKPKAEVPKPKTPDKPKEPTKPREVKIVEKPLPPKKVEKVQQVKAPTPEPKVEMPQTETKVTTTVRSSPVVTQAPKADPVPDPTPQVDMTPRDLGDAAGVAWKRKPKPRLNANDLKTTTSDFIVIRINVDEKGKISPTLVKSCGNDKVDKEFLRAVRAAQFTPYKENGVAVPFVAEQSFHLQ